MSSGERKKQIQEFPNKLITQMVWILLRENWKIIEIQKGQIQSILLNLLLKSSNITMNLLIMTVAGDHLILDNYFLMMLMRYDPELLIESVDLMMIEIEQEGE